MGVKAVKENGGLRLVQDPEEAQFDGMPQAAIASRSQALTAASPAAPATHLAGVDFAALERQLDPVRPYLGHLGEMPGSNNWIVDGAHSATGNTLVANDPHLSLLSPSVWWDRRSILRRIRSLPETPRTRLWIDTGTNEGAGQLPDVRRLDRVIRAKGWDDDLLALHIEDGGGHDEASWAARLPAALEFLYPPS